MTKEQRSKNPFEVLGRESEDGDIKKTKFFRRTVGRLDQNPRREWFTADGRGGGG